MIKIKFLLLLCFFVLVKILTAQINTDSLILELKNNHNDTIKLQLLSDLNWYLGRVDLEKSLKYAEDELALAKKINNQKYIAQGLNDIGISLLKQSKFKESLAFQQQALQVRLKIGNKSDIASSYSKIGYCLSEMDEFKDALAAQLLALKIYKEIDDKKYTAYTLNNICNLYTNLKNYKKVLEYAQESYKLATLVNDVYSKASALNFLSSYYELKGDFLQAIKNEKLALLYFYELADSSGIGAALNNIGYYYRQIYNDKIALDYFLKALKIAELTRDINSIGLFHNNIGNVYISNNDYTNAAYHLKLAQKICTEQGMESSLLLVYKSFGDLYALTGKGKLAVENYNKYAALKDSIFSMDMSEQFTNMQTKYETNEKEAANLLLKKENELTNNKLIKSNIVKWGLVIGIVLLVLLFYLFYNSFKLKQQLILDAQLLQQQEENSKAIIEAEERERTRIARDLHDGIGQQLSAAKLNMVALKNRLNISVANDILLFNNVTELIDDAVNEVRQVSHIMMANSLIKHGLIMAVRDFIQKLNQSAGLKINIETYGIDERLDATKEMILFRVLQEIVNNILKHAHATQVSIQFVRHENELSLLIEDNGVGFDTNKMEHFQGIGLKNIQSRINFIHGKVFFDSFITKGTTVNIEVPL